MNNHQIVNDYLRAVTESIEKGGEPKFWPFAPGQVDSYFIDLLALSFWEKFKKDPERFKKALYSISLSNLRWFLLPSTILGLKLVRKYDGYKVEAEEMVSFIETVWGVLKQKAQSDPFCLDGKNIILTSDEVEKVMENSYWFNAGERKIVNFLSADVESFVWVTSFDVFAYGVFWHGPYVLSGDKTLLTKRFFDLDSPVWDINNHYKEIEISYLFKGKIDVEIDFMEHMTYEEDIWSKLLNVAVTVDGHQVCDLDELKKISEYFAQKRDIQFKLIESLSPESLIKKSAEVYYYMFHEFLKYYNEDWRPSDEVDQRIKEWGLKYWEMFKPTSSGKKRQSISFFAKLYDPRNGFTG